MCIYYNAFHYRNYVYSIQIIYLLIARFTYVITLLLMLL